jgi:hypothetical protein
MKALSVKQPAANKIASGEKTIEVRPWPTSFRGPILIVSSKKPNIEPAGCALAVVDLVDCKPMRQEHVDAACCSKVYPECFAWVLRNVRKILPFPLRGSLGLFEVDVNQIDLDADERIEIDHRLSKTATNLVLDI